MSRFSVRAIGMNGEVFNDVIPVVLEGHKYILTIALEEDEGMGFEYRREKLFHPLTYYQYELIGVKDLLQSTGKVGKDGKEIFEGDRINYSTLDVEIGTGIVEWDDKDCSFVIRVEYYMKRKKLRTDPNEPIIYPEGHLIQSFGGAIFNLRIISSSGAERTGNNG